MHPKSKVAVLLLVGFTLLTGLLVNCGGGDQSSDGSQGDGKKQNAAPKKNAPEAKMALGTIKKVNPDKRRIALRPAAEAQGGERMVFILRKEKAPITLDGKKAEMTDVKEGQQAQIEYVVRKWGNQARALKLFSRDEEPKGGEQTG